LLTTEEYSDLTPTNDNEHAVLSCPAWLGPSPHDGSNVFSNPSSSPPSPA